MNLYFPVDDLKSDGNLDIKASGLDLEILDFIEEASRFVENYCGGVRFYEYSETRVLDGSGSSLLRLATHDNLIAVTTLKTDPDGDLDYDDTWTTSDYLLRPNNADPTTRNNSASKPYTEIVVHPNSSNFSFFPSGFQRVQIAGFWGYWRHLKTATETLNEELDASETGVDVSALTDVKQGHTIQIDSEQMFVESYDGNELTVIRGVNGTTAATHSSGAAISIYEYPRPVVRATMAQASRLLQRSRNGFLNQIGWEQSGATGIGVGIDMDFRQLLDAYRHPVIA